MKKVLALILALVMVLGLVACGSKDAGNTGSNNGSTGTETKKEDKKEDKKEEVKDVRHDVIMQLSGEPATLDYQQDNSVITHVLMGNVNAALVQFDKNNQVVGELADSWEWNDEFTQVTFHLRDGIKFSDGTPITSKDVIYTFSRGMDLGYSSHYNAIDTIEAPDDATVVINLKQPNTIYLNILALCTFAIMPEGTAEKYDVGKEWPVSSGEYYVTSWVPGDTITLKANPYYFKGEPSITDVKYVFIGDENSALVALETGEIDIMQGSSNISATSFARIEQVDGLTTIRNAKETYAVMCLNFDMPELADINVRKAIDNAINRSDICAVVGQASPAGSVPITPTLTGYIEGYDATVQDLAKAKEYMAQSAYPNGFDIELMCGSGVMAKVANVIQANLAEIGINITIAETDGPTVIERLTNGSYQFGIVSWGNANGDVTNPAPLYQVGESMHFSNDPDPTIGNLLNKSLAATASDREAILKQAFDEMTDHVPYIGLYWPNNYYGINADLKIDMPISVAGYVLSSMHWD